MEREKIAAIGLVLIIALAVSGFLLIEYGGDITGNIFGEQENKAPTNIKLIKPEADSVISDLSMNLSWSADDPNNDELTYDVYFETSEDPETKVVNNQTQTEYSPNGLLYNTDYYWKIVARDSEGLETEGPVWKFSTSEPPVSTGGTAEIGDSVIVDYTGRFQVNDTIFDTSKESVARQAGIYDEEKTYEPMKIFINPNYDLATPEGFGDYTFQMISGFINGLTNMTEGQNKTVVIPPDEGYGTWNESIAEQLLGTNAYPLESSAKYVVSEATTDFQGTFPDVDLNVGTTFDYGYALFQKEGLITGEITESSVNEVTYQISFENNTSTKIPIFGWDITFVDYNETHYKVISDVEEGYSTVYPYIFGNINILVESVNETHAMLSMNIGAPAPYFVGETLIFELEIIKIYKTSELS